VDISVQQSVTQATLAATIASAVGHDHFSFGVPSSKTSLDLSGSGSRTRRSKWRLKDGLVEMHLGLGPASGGKTNNFFAWMRDEGHLPERMWRWDWVALPAAIKGGEVSEEDLEDARVATAAFFATKQKSEIVDQAMRRKILMAPICTVEDLIESPHHRLRGFFQTVQDGDDVIVLPGDFAKGLDGGFAPLAPAPTTAPVATGEGGLRLAPSDAPAPAPTPKAGGPAPFDGLKVLDLAWVVAGPAVGRVLADYGARVVRVESSKRVDTARLMGPFPGGGFDRERSACFETYNAGKLGLALDLGQETAREVVRDLVRWADVVVESFAPGQMERWGLGYEALRTIKPDLILLSTSLMGQSGPYAAFAGFGNIGAAMAGFQSLVGWPDAPPIGPFGPYTDYVGPRFGLAALLAALHRRAQTGHGAWLDVSQAEAGMQFLAPEIAEFSATGLVATALGNRDRHMSPHGVFPCAGEDRWIAIAVRDDDDWRILAGLIGGEAADLRFATLEARRREEAALEALLSAWTGSRPVEALEAELQAAGIAAHRASTSEDMVADPQLIHRGHYVHMAHEQGGESVIEASRFALSDTPAIYRRTAPSFGRDTLSVLRDILGYGSAQIERLEAAGVLI
jgi:crotonobetainyl-CoA:carnitine CoA-transferase CaiB-like acyl-CoA transferase